MSEVNHRNSDTEAKSVSDFSILLREKLAMRRGYGSWGKIPIPELVEWLHGELGELQSAIHHESFDNVKKECADVAILAMFISENIDLKD